jgi:hypothetical protein
VIKALGFESCGAGYHFDTNIGGCVVDAPTTTPPATADSKLLMYGGIALALILLLGAFAGGRASKSGAATGTRKRVTKSFWVTF